MKRAHCVRAGIWLSVVCVASAPRPAAGQSSWPSYPNNTAISVTTSGNVGIGTTSPTGKLQINTANSPGIDGTAALVLDRIYDSVGDYQDIVFGGGYGNVPLRAGIIRSLAVGPGESGFAFLTQTGIGDAANHESMRILGNGNVGIGTTTPEYKLAVNGTIGAKEVIVTNTGWPDFVFKPNYRLRPLSEVAAYIEQNRRLPDVPSENEVREQGVNIGEMQAKLLAKVEELTLHMIELDKQNRALREEVAKLAGRHRSQAGAAR